MHPPANAACTSRMNRHSPPRTRGIPRTLMSYSHHSWIMIITATARTYLSPTVVSYFVPAGMLTGTATLVP